MRRCAVQRRRASGGPWMDLAEGFEAYVNKDFVEKEADYVERGRLMAAARDIKRPRREELDLTLRVLNAMGRGRVVVAGFAERTAEAGVKEWGKSLSASQVFGYLRGVQKTSSLDPIRLVRQIETIVTDKSWLATNAGQLQVPQRILHAARSLSRLNIPSPRLAATLSRCLATAPDVTFTHELLSISVAMWHISSIRQVSPELGVRMAKQITANPLFVNDTLGKNPLVAGLLLPYPVAVSTAGNLRAAALERLRPFTIDAVSAQLRGREIPSQRGNQILASVAAYSYAGVEEPLMYHLTVPTVHKKLLGNVKTAYLVRYVAYAVGVLPRGNQDLVTLLAKLLNDRRFLRKASSDEIVNLIAASATAGIDSPHVFGNDILKETLTQRRINLPLSVFACGNALSILLPYYDTTRLSQDEQLSSMAAFLANPPSPEYATLRYAVSESLTTRFVTDTPTPCTLEAALRSLQHPTPHPLLEAIAAAAMRCTAMRDDGDFRRRLLEEYRRIPQSVVDGQVSTKRGKVAVEGWVAALRK
eukprot:TRINITY_DN8102_c0_g1_i1.p1 TRINITY_DN8102_c0_g1~~TRINITY_DN8102_c0_g1_i1.p1  ORF type:complete len:532 (+),score=40.42 TRINITY_DN8102_c0_g1_i1:834-2429(+)